jgi:hypothetical protein
VGAADTAKKRGASRRKGRRKSICNRADEEGRKRKGGKGDDDDDDEWRIFFRGCSFIFLGFTIFETDLSTDKHNTRPQYTRDNFVLP